jgi:hypothetical protein
MLDQSFASEIPPSPEKIGTRMRPLSTWALPWLNKGGHCLYPISPITSLSRACIIKKIPFFSFLG